MDLAPGTRLGSFRITALVGAVLYDQVTLAWSGGLAFVVVRIVAFWFVSAPVMALVVALAHGATKGRSV